MSRRISDKDRLLRTVTERAWTTQVIEMARRTGWLAHHSRPAWVRSGRMVTALQGAPGLPDLILVRPPRLMFVELKRQAHAAFTPAQRTWLKALEGCPGVEVYEWRPGDAKVVWEILSGVEPLDVRWRPSA